ncbi:MAG: glycosyltransferase [Lewinellaceae bacterium]|nr:glycosyltransferase [Lewinellaceae bacterium]
MSSKNTTRSIAQAVYPSKNSSSAGSSGIGYFRAPNGSRAQSRDVHHHFTAWIASLIWFQPRLLMLLDMTYGVPGPHGDPRHLSSSIDFAWLYGMYNLGVVSFATLYGLLGKKVPSPDAECENSPAPVAILYTTCNDFVEESVVSCVRQNYPNYTVYILDDSSRQEFEDRIDAFAAQYPGLVRVVRRPDRKAFKAGNMNYGLANFAHELYFNCRRRRNSADGFSDKNSDHAETEPRPAVSFRPTTAPIPTRLHRCPNRWV